MAKIDLKYCTLRMQDGDTPENWVEMKIGEGTLTYTEKRNMEYTKDRGILDTVREGDEEPMDVRFDLLWEFLKSSSGVVPTPEEALKFTGPAASWVSTSDDLCEPKALDIIVIYEPPCGGEKMELVILPDFRYEQLDHDLKAGTIAVTGKCNAKEASVQRITSTSSAVY